MEREVARESERQKKERHCLDFFFGKRLQSLVGTTCTQVGSHTGERIRERESEIERESIQPTFRLSDTAK